MILKDTNKDLNLTFSFRVNGFSYIVFATFETMKCFGGGAEGHLIKSCPEVGESASDQLAESPGERPADL